MSAHLNSEQVVAAIAGEAECALQEHLASCAECAREVGRMQEALGGFRAVMREYTAQQLVAENFGGEQQRRAVSARWIPGLMWSVAAALVVAVLLGWNVHRNALNRTAAGVAGNTAGRLEQAAASDTALLKQLDQQVSRTVPAAMEPLVQLVSWDGEAGTEGARTGSREASN